MDYSNLITFLATGFYLGKIPKAPGTFGTLGAIPFWLLIASLNPLASVILTLVMVVLAIIVADLYEKKHGGHDHPEIVIDEIAGFLVTMTLVPIRWQYLALGFVLFRLLDILKPYPISYLDRKIQGGIGVVIDDVAAGLIANVILQVILQFCG